MSILVSDPKILFVVLCQGTTTERTLKETMVLPLLLGVLRVFHSRGPDRDRVKSCGKRLEKVKTFYERKKSFSYTPCVSSTGGRSMGATHQRCPQELLGDKRRHPMSRRKNPGVGRKTDGVSYKSGSGLFDFIRLALEFSAG